MSDYRILVDDDCVSEVSLLTTNRKPRKRRRPAKSCLVPMQKLFDESCQTLEKEKKISAPARKKIKGVLKSLSRILTELDDLEHTLTEDVPDFSTLDFTVLKRKLKKSRNELNKLYNKK